MLESFSHIYKPLGNHKKVWSCKDRILVSCGAAGTGKTRCDLEKALAVAENCPGSRQLFLRRVKKSLATTVLDEWEERVLPPGHPALTGASRRLRDQYTFPNGSEIRVGGLDTKEDADKVMSAQYDRIIIFEATDIKSPDPVIQLLTRLRNGKTSYHQIILECNPSAPSHWIKQWADQDKATMITSKHTDNPRWWDSEKEEWTPAGKDYMSILNNLEGTARSRYLDGHWTQADGLVYDTFEQNIHVQESVNDYKKVLIAVDDGYTDPFAALRIEIDHDGRANVAEEVYQSQMDIEAKIDAIRELSKNDNPNIIYDAAAAVLGAELRKHFMNVKACNKKLPITSGIDLVRTRLKDPGDSIPRLVMHPNCTNLIKEFESYEWKKRSDGTGKDQPIDQNNHALDALRYAFVELDSNPTVRVSVLYSNDYDSGFDNDDALWN